MKNVNGDTPETADIRKAFERVKTELETESSSNMELETAPFSCSSRSGSRDELRSPDCSYKAHGIFSLTNPQAAHSHLTGYHARMSSLDSTNSDDGSFSLPSCFSYGIGVKDNYGSITSLASSTSLISPQVRIHCHLAEATKTTCSVVL